MVRIRITGVCMHPMKRCPKIQRYTQKYVWSPRYIVCTDETGLYHVLFSFPGLFKLVVQPMAFPKETREFLGALMGLGISTGFAMSVQIRCICFLLIPTFFGKAGRSYVGTFAISFLIAGN